MDRRQNRNLFVVAVAGMFCWLSASVVSAQTATNLNCAWCVGPGEVAWNAVGWWTLDPSLRQGLTAQQNDIDVLKQSAASPGVQVMVDGATVGTMVIISPPRVEVNLTSGGTALVSEAAGGLSGNQLIVLSPTGYLFRMSGSTTDDPPLSVEGEIRRLSLLFDQIDCNGNRYFAVEGSTGVFSNFVEGDGRPRPLARWAARQGWVFASPDPSDLNQTYFLRKDAVVTAVTMQSFLFTNLGTQMAMCLNFSQMGWDLDPLLADHTVVPVEVNDPAVTGVSGILGGDISIGF